MTLAVWQGLAADESSGDLTILASPTVTVTDRATGGNATLFEDRDGNTGLSNPFTGDADGSIEFYVKPGRYKVEAASGGNTATWDNQIIGTLHGIDQPDDEGFPEYDDANDRWVSRPPGYVNPEHATASGSPADDYDSATNTSTPGDGVKITRDFQSASTTTTPTLDGKTMTTRDGSALWAEAVSGVHNVQYDSGADTYLVLDPIPVIADSTEKTGADDKVVSGTAGTDGNLVQWNADGDAVDGPDLLDEDDMASDSATAVPTQQSVKAYADTQDATFEQQRAQAWVNFDGTGTVSIRDHYNVSSITDNGTGNYTVNFSSALADSNYTVSGSTNNAGATDTRNGGFMPESLSTTNCVVITGVTHADTAADRDTVSVAIFGGN